MLDDEQREAFVAQLAQELGDARRLGRGGAGGRLVDEQHRRAGRVGGGEHQHALVARRAARRAGPSRGSPKRARIALGLGDERRVLGAVLRRREERAEEARAPAPAGRGDEQVLERGQRREDRRRLQRARPPRRRRRSVPASGAIVPASMRSTVVLPEPFGPISAVTVPGCGAERDVVRRDERAVALDEAAAPRGRARQGARARCPRRSGAASPA